MLHAVYVRTLKQGVTDDQFVEAWMPPTYDASTYPARVTMARSLEDPRQVLSVFDVDVEPERFAGVLPQLVHPDSERRLAEVVESTSFAGVFRAARTFGGGAP